MYLWSRILLDERRIEAGEMRKLDIDTMAGALTKIRNEYGELAAQVLSVEESLQHLNNKWNARLRTETAAEKRREKKDEEEETTGAAEYEQMALNLPGVPPNNGRRRRGFGEFPG